MNVEAVEFALTVTPCVANDSCGLIIP